MPPDRRPRARRTARRILSAGLAAGALLCTATGAGAAPAFGQGPSGTPILVLAADTFDRAPVALGWGVMSDGQHRWSCGPGPASQFRVSGGVGSISDPPPGRRNRCTITARSGAGVSYGDLEAYGVMTINQLQPNCSDGEVTEGFRVRDGASRYYFIELVFRTNATCDGDRASLQLEYVDRGVNHLLDSIDETFPDGVSPNIGYALRADVFNSPDGTVHLLAQSWEPSAQDAPGWQVAADDSNLPQPGNVIFQTSALQQSPGDPIYVHTLDGFLLTQLGG